jgi:SnoaL-like domain
LILAVTAMLLSAPTAVAAESGSQTVEAYLQALDQHDAAAAVALFDPDAEVTLGLPTLYDVPVRVALGRDQVQAWLRAVVVDNGHLVPLDSPEVQPQIEGERVVWRVRLEQGALGKPLLGTIRAFVRDGHLVRLAHVFARQDAVLIEAAWAKRARPEDSEAPSSILWLTLSIVPPLLVFLVRRRPNRYQAAPRDSGLIAQLGRAHVARLQACTPDAKKH